MPANTVKVDRSTKWGNPFKAGEFAIHPKTGKQVVVRDKHDAIALFSLYLRTAGVAVADAAVAELRGRNLGCWCKAGDACHGDVLIRVANRTLSSRPAA